MKREIDNKYCCEFFTRFLLFAVVFLFVFSLLQVSKADAANYYVDKDVSSSGDGTSWDTAWKTFADIEWGEIDPGETLYISGGTSGKTYTNDPIVVQASGDASNQITITAGIDEGHDGEVLLEGNYNKDDSNNRAISITNPTSTGYITISNLNFKGWSRAVRVYGEDYTAYTYADAVHGVIIENNNITLDTDKGITIVASDNCIVRNNHLESLVNVQGQTDGIGSGMNHNNIYENNTIIIHNQDLIYDGHNDCIQLQIGDTDITVRGNYCEHTDSKIENSQGMMTGDLFGTIRIYNNIFKINSGGTSVNLSGGETGDAQLEVIGNTVFSPAGSTLYMITDFNNPIIKNNIGVSTGPAYNVLNVSPNIRESILVNYSRISNNLFWDSDDENIMTISGIGYPATQEHLEEHGANLGGLNVDPQFRDPDNRDFTPTNSDVCTASDTGSYIGAVPCEQDETVCTSFVHSDWGSCQSNNTQSRTRQAGLPFGCTGGTPQLTQSCTYVSPATTNNDNHNSSSGSSKSKSKPKRSIKTSPSKVSRGGTIRESGTRFSKNSPVLLYFEKTTGVFFPPKKIITNKAGKFSISYQIPKNKAPGKYNWYAIDPKTGKKSKTATYEVRK